MSNQSLRRVPKPNPKQLPNVQPNSPNEPAERWNRSRGESTPTSRGETSPSIRPVPSSVHSEDSRRLPYGQRLSSGIKSPKFCDTSRSSSPSPQPLEGGPYLSSLNEWTDKAAQAELRVAPRYSMNLYLLSNLALWRRSAFSESGDESLSR